jgi:hypothetical protein
MLQADAQAYSTSGRLQHVLSGTFFSGLGRAQQSAEEPAFYGGGGQPTRAELLIATSSIQA